eukprot:5025748-Alexandrium_andersonii.AAC.1
MFRGRQLLNHQGSPSVPNADACTTAFHTGAIVLPALAVPRLMFRRRYRPTLAPPRFAPPERRRCSAGGSGGHPGWGPRE